MAATPVDIGYGLTITFASGFFAKITEASWSGYSRNAIDSSHMTSTNGYRTFIPGDLKDVGELSVSLLFDKNAATKTNLAGAAETITVTFPTPSGGSTGGTWACSGFMTNFDMTLPMDDMMTADATIKFTGEPTLTDGS